MAGAKELADIACQRITDGITAHFVNERPVKAVLDPYNPTGSTRFVKFNTSRMDRWETDPRRCHINWVVLHSDWEAEFCRVAEAHPRVQAYVKNYNLGLEVPYRSGSETRIYLPDFVVMVDDGHGEDDLLHLVVEIKGYRQEDAKQKKQAMDTYWIPGVNNLGQYGRWAFAEFTDVYEIQSDFETQVAGRFEDLIDEVVGSNDSPSGETPYVMVNHVRTYYGSEPKWSDISRRIYYLTQQRTTRDLDLTDFTELAAATMSSEQDVLAVLTALCTPPHAPLFLDLVSMTDGAHLAYADLLNALRGWWRHRDRTDEEWERWAASIHVRWISGRTE